MDNNLCPVCYVNNNVDKCDMLLCKDRITPEISKGAVYKYARCNNCKSLYLLDEDNAIKDNIDKYYVDYLCHQWKVEEGINGNMRIKANKIINDYKLNENDSVLDYGGADIHLVWTLHSMGVGQKESDMRVYDKYAKSMVVGDIRVENSLPTNREFSFIYCSHVIEHMQNPLDLINDISKLLKGNGKAVIIYPNVHSLAFEYYKENWMPLDPPRHLTLPSYKYLVEAIKGMNTFSKVEVTMKNSIEFPLLASECYKQGKLYKDIDEVYNGKNNDNVKFKESAKGFTHIINKMMLGDEVTIILTK